MLCMPPLAAAEPSRVEPSLTIEQAVAMARASRAEIAAARAAEAAAAERPAIVSALDDPMLMGGIDHYPRRMMPGEPQMGGRYDWSITLEQRFPLSRVRQHRRRGAEAEWQQRRADTGIAMLDVERDAAEAFLMLREQRRMLGVNRAQLGLAEQMLDVASARLSAAGGSQADVLRIEVTLARLQGEHASLQASARSARAMFNASIGRDPALPVPPLHSPVDLQSPAPAAALVDAARDARPELRRGTAEIARAAAEVDVMRSMYRPMAVVRAGQASTMAEGEGAMLMVGISIPLWRGPLRAGVAEARAMEAMARADLEAMRLMVDGEVVAARESVLAARAEVLALRDDVLPRARIALEPTVSAYASGTGSLLSVLDAAQALWMAEAELVMAETGLGLAWARLDRARGAGREVPR
jgi:outer membrane protein, heavy metal efflux system